MSSLPTPTGPDARPRWHRRKEARPAEITAAALDLFVERGFNATRLEDVARRAGVTKGTLYLYFPNKAELFKAAVRESLVPVLELGERLVSQHRGSARDLIESLIRGWWEHVGRTNVSGIPKLVMAEAGNFPELANFYHDEITQRGRELVRRALRMGIERGEFRNVPVEETARLAFAPVLFAVLWKHSFAPCERRPMDPEALLDAHVDVFLRGIAAHPETEDRP